MTQEPVGQEWLKRHFKLADYTLTHSSYIGSNGAIELTSSGNVEQTYGSKYQPKDQSVLAHIDFSLKYDDLSLDFLKEVFRRVEAKDVEHYQAAAPASKNARRIGFLYEFLTGKTLTLVSPVSGNYVDLLDPEKYVTGTSAKSAKWRINDNLLGTTAYCPVVRRTPAMKKLLSLDVTERIGALQGNYPADIFRRAIAYLYKKETKSSFEIEHEKPPADRMERFVTLLTRVGSEPPHQMLSDVRLIGLQNAIVDPRFAAMRYRDFQNFVGRSLPNYTQHIDYICPPPAWVESMIDGLRSMSDRTRGARAEVVAGMISFGFVFIHPFEDGNGRIHRFLIHDVLNSAGMVPAGIIIPVSAHMLNNIKIYDDILEKYSIPLMRRIRYTQAGDGTVTVTNSDAVEGYFRYPDLTEQCIYLMHTVHATLEEDMPQELLFIQRYDEARRELQTVVDMPDKDIDTMLTFLHQNKGVFPKRRRDYFRKLTDEEIARMQETYRKVFEMDV